MASLSHPLCSPNHLFFSVPILFLILMGSSISFANPLCHSDERLALLQFMQSFVLNESASFYSIGYPKVASWKNHSDCCLWDGIECDKLSGHVIGLDLSSSWLYGSFNSNSSLFHLVHLQKLNLADNDFNSSQIPSNFGLLSSLTHLDLSNSGFSGQIPIEITTLSNFTSLDLSRNGGLSTVDLRRLVQNLTRLEKLDLSSVNVSSTLPENFANLSSLTYLDLSGCILFGFVPSLLEELTNLRHLDLSGTRSNFKWGGISWLGKLSKLETLYAWSIFNSVGESLLFLKNLTHLHELDLGDNQLIGQIPSWLSNITKLTHLYLSFNQLNGPIPESISQLVDLEQLSLEYNLLTGKIPSSLLNITQLTLLSFGSNQLNGPIPDSISQLVNLELLSLESNQFTGKIPSSLKSLAHLRELSLGFNQLHGPIPESISQLINLESLDLAYNQLTAIVTFEMFSRLENLTSLDLSGNNLTFHTNLNMNATRLQWDSLGLSDCNLREFPDFIRHLDRLYWLCLNGNKISGRIPIWIGNISGETLYHMDLSNNFLSGFEDLYMFSPLKNVLTLDLSFNAIEGPHLFLPSSIMDYNISNNLINGEIPLWFCNLSSLVSLDVSNNNMTGVIPQCLGNFSDSLVILNLENNSFHGNITDAFSSGSSLNIINLSHNQLSGRIPRSLANCRKLVSLIIIKNHICDEFPFWLGNLTELKVLMLRSNNLFGVLRKPANGFGFHNMQIMDLSHNNFTGVLPPEFFHTMKNMQAFHVKELEYMDAQYETIIPEDYFYHMILANKGLDMKYEKIQNTMVAIDLSSNNFYGDLPESIGTLKMLRVLNISNNRLSSQILPVLGNLTNLESLDLSHNNLSGEIPPQLLQLTFLEHLNVSYNQLEGHILEGKQFSTFDNSSYQGNSKLCGNPLTRKCGNLVSMTQPEREENGGFKTLPIYVDWKTVIMGYGCGLVVGVGFGLKFSTRHHQAWLLNILSITLRRSNRRRNIRRGHAIVFR